MRSNPQAHVAAHAPRKSPVQARTSFIGLSNSSHVITPGFQYTDLTSEPISAQSLTRSITSLAIEIKLLEDIW